MAAVRAARRALELISPDSEVSYLANAERQLAVERLLDLPPMIASLERWIDASGNSPNDPIAT